MIAQRSTTKVNRTAVQEAISVVQQFRTRSMTVQHWVCETCGMPHSGNLPESCDSCGASDLAPQQEQRPEIGSRW